MKQNYVLKIKLSIALTMLVMVVNAQLVSNNYTFAQSNGSMTPLVGGNVLGNSTNDDNPFNNITFPSGFVFNYNGTLYTSFSVNPNGYIQLGGTNPIQSSNVISTGNTNNVIAALNQDLIGQPGSVLSWQVQGSGLNEIMIIEWSNYNMWRNAGGSNVPGVNVSLNFQIQLYKTLNKIQIVYGTMTVDSSPFYPTAEVGLRGNSITDFNIRKVTTTWLPSATGLVNTDNCVLSQTVAPATGVTYTWTRTTVNADNIEQAMVDNISIYPNPSKGNIKLSISDCRFEKLVIKMYDVAGKQVYSSVDTSVYGVFSREIPTTGFKKGAYFIKFESGEYATVHRIVLQ
jgi:hypothetical protein